MAHVFLSYARQDARFAREISRRLRDAQLKPWQDLSDLRGGDDWQAAIDNALRNADVLVVVMTPYATKSQYVTYEWAFAFGAGVRVIPVLHKKTELHPRLASFHYIDFTTRRGTPWIDLWKALPTKNSRAQAEPEICARFCLSNGVPELDGDYYEIDVAIDQAPRGTRSVTYELHDETLAQRQWSTKAKAAKFTSRMRSDGDILITATMSIASRRPLRIASTLYDALRRGHGKVAGGEVRAALRKIKEYRAHS